MIVYIQEQNTVVRKSLESLEIRKQGELVYKVPFIGIDRLVVIGNVQVTTQTLHALSSAGVDVVYFTRSGKPSFVLNSPLTSNVFLKLAQFSCMSDPMYCLSFSKEVSKIKIASQIQLVSVYNWTGDFDWQKRIIEMEGLSREIDKHESKNELRGYEGRASRLYFECFSAMLTKMQFDKRTRRPAGDRTNALMNLGYAFLANECASALVACGLDPYIGFLHEIVYARQSLALDIMEPFRAPVVDRLIVRLINWGMLQESDFVEDEKIGFRLNEEGYKTFIGQYEKQMVDGEESFRAKIRESAEKLKHSVQTKTEWSISAIHS
ncbi:MAG: CRISPR-associated endonuclease Cas1 [Eubacteriaceae bacterium]|nr:CRISPR-associated endonuclease Cas1 [Eubacteriaceae bacterium]